MRSRKEDINHPSNDGLWTTRYVESLLLKRLAHLTPEEKRHKKQIENKKYRETHGDRIKQRRNEPFIALNANGNPASFSMEADIGSRPQSRPRERWQDVRWSDCRVLQVTSSSSESFPSHRNPKAIKRERSAHPQLCCNP